MKQRRAAMGVRTGVKRLAAAALACLVAFPAFGESRSLADVERDVARDHPVVSQLSSDDLTALIARAAPLVVFDAREEAEYRVSRIRGAVRVDPGVAAQRFLREHGTAVGGKTVVFYCSVGVRSSRLAERLKTALHAQGASAVHNLAGGIFRWHNESRPLANDAGATAFVHPYDKAWGKLLSRPDLARYAPN